MTVRLYKSTDASAPTLSGSAGALLTVLDAVLVNGYGSQTAAGWTIAFTGTNKRQYAMAAGGTSCQLYIDDSGPGAGTTREARINGFKTGTGIGTGTGQFPTTAQQTAPSGAVVVRKSTTADATARAWTIIADGHTIYMFIETGDRTSPLMSYPWMFGDFFSYYSGDTNNCAIIARNQENSGQYATVGMSNSILWGNQVKTSMVECFSQLVGFDNTILSHVLYGHYICANYTGVGGSIGFGKHSDQTKMGYPSSAISMLPQMGALWSPTNGITSPFSTAFPYPNAADGGLYLAPIWITHNGMVRGYFKGLWNPCQHLPLGHNDTISGTGNLSGKSLIAQMIHGTGTMSAGSANEYPTQVVIEYSDTWV